MNTENRNDYEKWEKLKQMAEAVRETGGLLNE